MTHWNIKPVMQGLQQARHQWREGQQRHKETGGRELPSKETLQGVLNDLCGVLFPMRLGPNGLLQQSEDYYIAYTLNHLLDTLFGQVCLSLKYDDKRLNRQLHPTVPHITSSTDLVTARAQHIVQAFADQLASIRQVIDSDVYAAYKGDPAAHSVDEVLLCYPGVLAIIYHRLAHQLYPDVPILSRMISELAHSSTGIDIHPGAEIGQGFFIDHGTGVVIGETCIIGQSVRIYQAVTLGAKHFEFTENGSLKKDYPRHPIVEDNVIIYAGATILGRIRIGKDSIIGGNVWLTHDVAAGSHIVQSPLETFSQPPPNTYLHPNKPLR